MYSGTEQLSEGIANCGKQVLTIGMGGYRETGGGEQNNPVVMDESWREYKLMFSLTQIWRVADRNTLGHVKIYISVHMCIFLFCQPTGPGGDDIPVAETHLAA